MYGWYAEEQWASIIVSTIESKRDKVYSDRVDLLLIDDSALPYTRRKEVIKRFELLKKKIENNSYIFTFEAFPSILTDTPKAIGIIRQEGHWLYNPLFLPDGWMAE